MTTLREKALPLFSKARTKLVDQKAGLRRYTVYVRRETPNDARMGRGSTLAVVDTLLTEKPRVRPANDRDIVMGGGRVQAGDWIMDRITPRNDGNTVGTTLATINITPTATGQKVFIVLDGPGMPAYVGGPTPSGGGLFTADVLDSSRNFEFRFTLHPITGRR